MMLSNNDILLVR